MKNTLRALSICGLLSAAATYGQFGLSDVQFWIGAGADSSVLVVDFQDGTFDPSYAWGYLHDGTATGEDMLNAVAAADANFEVEFAGGFLNSITYGAHAGIGASPDYWSTWSGTDIATMAMNSGASEILGNGAWFGCSYTDFDPALEPTGPDAAFDPFRFTADDVQFWVGSGVDSAVVVVDFQNGSGTSSFAWGYLFSGTATGEDALNAIADADASFSLDMTGGFLNDITYNSYEGIGGSPNYWSTWSGTNLGNWFSNTGVGEVLNNGDLFGCSYTDFAPALRPFYPTAASNTTGIAVLQEAALQIYPQPATDMLTIDPGNSITAIVLFDITGKRVANLPLGSGVRSIDVSAWPAGSYVAQVGGVKRLIVVQ